ncbi:hypothetical protein RFI_18784 [Reticulomyxa filosa]|uniref:Uncharacterized protein n=1 Tax=Reticulomyxa filosa TaxID=46433 RepID=X6MYD3_RETFI|nr:hypothetical protein RFI_18784 [Reticulomyxa filosa]|eukprot:ETO18482.1 hypothetical protein RFI_18784 [Reticulomyxa filosa]
MQTYYWISIIFILSCGYQVSGECCKPIPGTRTCRDGTILSDWGGCCGKGACNIFCCNCDNGCREKPTDSWRVVSAQVYGGHKVFLGWHHVFIVLEDNYGKFHMLEVSPLCKEQQPIKIRHKTADSLSEAVALRWESNEGYEDWGSRFESQLIHLANENNLKCKCGACEEFEQKKYKVLKKIKNKQYYFVFIILDNIQSTFHFYCFIFRDMIT